MVDEDTLGQDTTLEAEVSSEPLTDVTAVPSGPLGNEVWATTIDGELVAIGAEPATLGAVRPIPLDLEVNRLVAIGDRLVLLPTWGRSVVIADLTSGRVLERLPIDSIPFRVVSDGQHAWVAGDGIRETLTRIDPLRLRIVEQFEVGTNSSTTTGPTQPFLVGADVWVPNRGDDQLVIVSMNPDPTTPP